MKGTSLNIWGYGHDFGNSETCGVVVGQGYHQTRVFPSVFAPGSWRDVETMAASAGKTTREYLQFGHYLLSYTNEHQQTVEKIMGQKVFDDGLVPSTTRADQERYWRNQYSLEALIVGSASAIPEPNYGLHLVTGLPVHLYTLDHVQAVTQALLGTHPFHLNNQARSLTVYSVKVVAEGAEALVAYGSDEDKVEGVIDIGGQTTDLYGARAQQPIRAMCKGLPKGVAAAADLFNTQFREQHGRLLPLDTCQTLLRQHISKQEYIPVRDAQRRVVQPVELAALIDYALGIIGQEIATFVAQTWQEQLYDMSRALIVGGGAYYFTQAIQARLPFARSVPQPELANAEGYARLAEVIAQRQQMVS